LDVPFESHHEGLAPHREEDDTHKDLVDENAVADEMATMILEKVSADEYVKDIKAGGWYI
jgi:hypothetical protein